MSIDSPPITESTTWTSQGTALDILRNVLGRLDKPDAPDVELMRQIHSLTHAGKIGDIIAQVKGDVITQTRTEEGQEPQARLDARPERPGFPEHLLRRTTELEAILHSAPYGIIVTNGKGEIIQTNLVAQGWLTETLSPADADRLREAVRSLAKQARRRRSQAWKPADEAESPEVIMELTDLNLELRAALTLGATSPAYNGGAVVAIHDVSRLRSINQKKAEFVSSASHELRTPVTTIKLFASLLRQTPPDSEQWTEYLDALAREADWQAQLVEDILEISRIRDGRMHIEPRPTSLNELTGMVVSNHQVLAQSRGLEMAHRPAESPVTVIVDPTRLMQVLNNLVENALNYTPEGGEVVVLTGADVKEGRIWATVTVADTGMGIPAEEMPHIFESFFRGEELRLKQIPGTGLGLAIVKEIVELHGGHVTVESPAKALRPAKGNVGSAFTVWLPLTE